MINKGSSGGGRPGFSYLDLSVEDLSKQKIDTKAKVYEMSKLLENYNTYGWQPNDELSQDENFSDLMLLITRTSTLRQGSMACLIVREEKYDNESMIDRIVAVSNNQDLFSRNKSDVHSEIAAIGQAALLGRSTANCTAYITMPPCRNCLGALIMAGIRRIVTRHKSKLDTDAMKCGVEMVHVDPNALSERVSKIVQTYNEQTNNILDDENRKRKIMES